MPERQLRIPLTVRLPVITFSASLLHRRAPLLARERHGKELRLLKFLKYPSDHPDEMCGLLNTARARTGALGSAGGGILPTLARRCRHGRRKRPHFNQLVAFHGLS